jgi:hypothetical protein
MHLVAIEIRRHFAIVHPNLNAYSPSLSSRVGSRYSPSSITELGS